MMNFSRLAQFLALSLTAACGTEQQVIFDGKTLKQWSGTPSVWRVEDGAITASIEEGKRLNKNEFLYWDGELANFDLTLDFKISGPTANSGIQIRSQQGSDGHAAGYQADLDGGELWLGRIYDEHGRGLITERGTLTKISPDGKQHSLPFSNPADLANFAKQDSWNEYRIRCQSHRIEIFINGIHFTTLEDYEHGQADLKGKLAVQIHSGAGPAKIQFRNIRLTQLPDGSDSLTATKEPPGTVPTDAPNIGFEKGTYEDWEITGTVWGGKPVKGDTIATRKRGNSSHQGSFWVGGYEQWLHDREQGTLLSKPFKISHPWASYRIGAGPTPQTRVEILDASNNEVVHKASGRGEIENMTRLNVDLSKHLGKTIRIRIIDEHSGPWGHINFDDFRFHSKPPSTSPSRLSSSPLLWGLTTNPAGDNNDTTSRMWIPKGFQVETIAKEPLLRQPIAFTFDSRGRIWIAEAFAYPRRQKQGEGKDRLIILEDTNNDGTFETHKIFADNLNLISGFEIGYGGVFVACAPEFIFIPDANGDDKPDAPPEVLLDGWDIRDTHETPNSFLWGHDGWLYGCHGVFNNSLVGKPGTPKEDRVSVKAAVWRFHPVTRNFEIYAHGGSNQWGLDYHPDGSLFMTHCRSSWGLGPVTQVFRDGHYWTQNNSNHHPFIATDKVGWNHTNPPLFNLLESAAAYGHGEGGAGKAGSRSIFGGHSHVGAMIYQGDNWPTEYRGDLFTHNLHGHQLNRERLSRIDSGYLSSSHGQDSLYADDKRYLAVDLKYGPDGAVYSIDWHDTQQCHVNDSARWDRSNGRLYRMSWTQTFSPAKFKNLSNCSEKDLITYLHHDNEWFARMAQHQLRQRAATTKISNETGDSLRKLLFEKNAHRFRYLVALHAVNGLTSETYTRLLTDPEESIRSQALHYLTERPRKDLKLFSEILKTMSLEETSSRVRLTLAGATQRRLPDEIALPILKNLAMRPEDAKDRFLPKMIWYAYSRFVDQDPASAKELALHTPLPLLRDSILWSFARRDLRQAIDLATRFKTPESISKATAIFHQVLTGKTKQPPPLNWDSFVAKAGETGDPNTIATLSRLNAFFGMGEARADTVAERRALAARSFAICAACHQPGLNQPGPSLEEIAQVYDNKKDILAWTIKPGKKRKNYPQMPPFDKLDARTLELAAEHLLSTRNNKNKK